MQKPTHFIEVYNPKQEYKHYEGVVQTNQTDCLIMKHLDTMLHITADCGVFQTVAVFKIKVKN